MALIRSFAFSLFIVLAGHSAVKAQNIQPAYLITAASDTLRGELLKKNTANIISQVKFKSEGSDFKSYTASEIKGYGLGDSLRYESREVLVNEESQTIFMQVLVDGPVKLYHAEGFHASYKYFLQKQQEPVIPLHKSYYAGTLTTLLKDCALLNLQKYKYNGISLSNLVHTYNDCQYAGQPSTILLKQSKLIKTWGVRAAAHMFTLSYSSEVGEPADHQFGWSPGVTAGLFFNFQLAGKRISVQPELLYTSRKLKNVHQHSQQYTLDYESVTELNAHYLQLPVLLKYKFGTGMWQPYLNAGFNYGLALSKDYKKTVTYETGYVNRTEMALDGYTLGYIAGAGIQRNALSLEARFSRDITNSNYIYKKIYYSAWQLALGFTF